MVETPGQGTKGRVIIIGSIATVISLIRKTFLTPVDVTAVAGS
jgi:hypothetical protein